MSNGGSGMVLPHVSMNLKSKWSNRCEEYWSNPWHFLSPSKAILVFLFLSHLYPSLFTFGVEEAASCRRDRLPKSISSKPKLDHPNLAKAARQHPEAMHCTCPKDMSNGGSGMLLPHVSTNLKNKWSNRCEEYWSNPWYFLSLKSCFSFSLFLSSFFLPLHFLCWRDRLSKNILSKLKLDHLNLTTPSVSVLKAYTYT
jgi:hypothetical protein